MKKISSLLSLALAFSLQLSTFAQTPVLFPINSLFGGAAYGKTITINAGNALLTDGVNLWAGTYINVPSTGTNPVILLYPNTYLMTVAGVRQSVRFTVPASTNTLNVNSLITSGPLFAFSPTNFASLVPGEGVTLVTNSDGSITINSTVANIAAGAGVVVSTNAGITTIAAPAAITNNDSRSINVYGSWDLNANVNFGANVFGPASLWAIHGGSGNFSFDGGDIVSDGEGNMTVATIYAAGGFSGDGSGIMGLTPDQVGAQPASANLTGWSTIPTNLFLAKNGSGSGLTGIAASAIVGIIPGTNISLPMPWIFYVATNGNDLTAIPGDVAHPWASFSNALISAKQSLSPALIQLGVGNWIAMSNTMITTNISIAGVGRGLSVLTVPTANQALGLIIAGNNVSLHDLTFGTNALNGTISSPLNFTSGTNVSLYRLSLYGDSDIIVNATTSSNFQAVIDSCDFHSGWDCIVMGGTGLATNANLLVRSCDFFGSADTNFSSVLTRGIVNAGAKITVQNCRFAMVNSETNAGSGTYCIFFQSFPFGYGTLQNNLYSYSSAAIASPQAAGVYIGNASPGVVIKGTINLADVTPNGATVIYDSSHLLSGPAGSSDASILTNLPASSLTGKISPGNIGILSITNLPTGTVTNAMIYTYGGEYGSVQWGTNDCSPLGNYQFPSTISGSPNSLAERYLPYQGAQILTNIVISLVSPIATGLGTNLTVYFKTNSIATMALALTLLGAAGDSFVFHSTNSGTASLAIPANTRVLIVVSNTAGAMTLGSLRTAITFQGIPQP